MQEAVGGHIEALGVDELKHGVSIYINDSGLIDELPINMTACMWLLQNGMYPALEHPIHGDVLVVGKTDEEGNSTDIPEDVEIPPLYREPKFEVITDPEIIANLFG